ncbi:unnamed protein product [Calicophoron daubneyi]|uniref:F-box domain-containing protein n=1 Tax=Calicophoron daubneyi TaxID=300641 RepID=A0AAV2T9P8_CALDB
MGIKCEGPDKRLFNPDLDSFFQCPSKRVCASADDRNEEAYSENATNLLDPDSSIAPGNPDKFGSDQLSCSPAASRLAQLDAIIDGCSHGELVHLKNTIEPLLKRDFVFLLPPELSLRILSYLKLNDILRCAQVSKHWNKIASDSLLWYHLCKREGVVDEFHTLYPTERSMDNKSHSVICSDQMIGENALCLGPYLDCARSQTSPNVEHSHSCDSRPHRSQNDWRQTYRNYVELQCNWRNGCAWPPTILPAHHNHVITCLEVYNDWAITGSDDSSICIWDLDRNELLISLFGHIGGVWSLTVLPPIVSTVSKDKPEMSLPLLVSGSCDRTARVWLLDGARWPCINTLFGHQSTVRCVAGQKLTVDEFCHSAANRTKLDSPPTVDSMTLMDDSVAHSDDDSGVTELVDSTTSTLLSPDELAKLRLVVTGSRDTTLRLWNAENGSCLRVFQGHRGAIRCVQFAGYCVASGSYDCTVRLWCILTGACLRVFTAHRNRVYTLLFDGSLVISASLDTTIRVWKAASGTLERTFCGHRSLTSELAYGKSQRILVSSNADETIRVWDIGSGLCLHVLAGPNKHQSAVTCVQLSRNFIISSSDDGTVKLWDRHTGSYVRDLVRLDGAGRGGVIWRIVASETRLVCAAGSRNGMENTKLIVLRFEEPAGSSSARGSVRMTSGHVCQPKPQLAPALRLSQLVASYSFDSDGLDS